MALLYIILDVRLKNNEQQCDQYMVTAKALATDAWDLFSDLFPSALLERAHVTAGRRHASTEGKLFQLAKISHCNG